MNPSNLSNPSKSPPASGKSRALMFIALDKLHNKGLRQAPHFKAFTLIEEAGHWVQFERADAFNEALLAVLDARP